MCNKIKVIAIIMIAIRIIFVVVCLCVNFLILDEKAIVFCVLLDFFHHSAEKLWIVACFYSVCSSSIPSRTLHWQRQTFLLICWTPPLPSYSTRKLKQDRKAYFSSLSPCLSSLSSLHCCPRQPWSNSDLWHMHHLYDIVSSLCVFVC